MDALKVDMYLTANGKYFPSQNIPYIRDLLISCDDSYYPVLMSTQFKDPTIAFVLSLVLGVLGIDRFYVGDIGLGVLKLLTGGVCGIMALVDWFLIMDRTREQNMQNLMLMIPAASQGGYYGNSNSNM